ncbi:rhodanese domain-containing protein CG4456-like [Colletes gigas]|uniref:rhodanese domain-containing protein CG4456-like n=1 Tax=Colletes gigas TaxID=935657 RepID=UPI001C9AD616|nr:rhodanese domain-containing protein CG4456-like [Colletes gigas]
MSITRELIMVYNKTRLFCKPVVSFRSFRCNSRIVQKTFTHDKLFNSTSRNRTFAIHDHSTLHFSIPIFLKSNFNTMSEGDQKSLKVYYKDILEAQKDDSVLIIDVREQSEVDQTGKLPGSIHIPMGDVTRVLNLSGKDFKDKFDKEKPSKDTRIILSCYSGKRSEMVQKELLMHEYQNVQNYVGGWSDWESNQKV